MITFANKVCDRGLLLVRLGLLHQESLLRADDLICQQGLRRGPAFYATGPATQESGLLADDHIRKQGM